IGLAAGGEGGGGASDLQPRTDQKARQLVGGGRIGGGGARQDIGAAPARNPVAVEGVKDAEQLLAVAGGGLDGRQGGGQMALNRVGIGQHLARRAARQQTARRSLLIGHGDG